MEKRAILIVDDEEIILQNLWVIFKREGIEVDTETDPLKAIERYREKNYGTVLLDIIMPRMNGFEVVRTLKEINPLVNVIMMTAFSTMSYVIECIEAGAVDYLTKPLLDTGLVIDVCRQSQSRVERWKKSFGLSVAVD